VPVFISYTNAVYTRCPLTVPNLIEIEWALVPTDFSAVVEALTKLTCTCDMMALGLRLGFNGIELVRLVLIVPVWFWLLLCALAALELKRAIETMAVKSIVAKTRNAILLYITWGVSYNVIYLFSIGMQSS
jgi:hypothetical protein